MVHAACLAPNGAAHQELLLLPFEADQLGQGAFPMMPKPSKVQGISHHTQQHLHCMEPSFGMRACDEGAGDVVSIQLLAYLHASTAIAQKQVLKSLVPQKLTSCMILKLSGPWILHAPSVESVQPL